ncbi:hypothetical protein DdX_14818 [Ditylenchus destructor]|uniref:Uncharacterized protein n=1 Tax=Ditylenchus destructor TaxID=166010 RepID=A0AAD4MTS1_9BILA|nr:hypothetical protein DdX_14818 [Ditylenchus destructor]
MLKLCEFLFRQSTVRKPIRAICLVLLWKKRMASIASELTTEFSANNTLATKSSQVHHNSSPRKTSQTRKFRYALQWELIHSVAVKDISIAVACKDVKLENATAGLLDASATDNYNHYNNPDVLETGNVASTGVGSARGVAKAISEFFEVDYFSK